MIAVELFAGAGGAALGLHRAGFHHSALVEWDAAACATLRAAVDSGRLDGEVIEGDVRTVDWSRFARPDLVWGSPPCQEWSTAGKRAGAKGERNGWPWFLDAIDALRPTWVAAENVDGMLKHAGSAHPGGGPVIDVDACPACWFKAKLLPEFERRFTSVQWTVYDAATLAVPQHRRRLILVAGPRLIVWPEETAARREIVPMFGTKRAYATVREALNLDIPIRHQSPSAGTIQREPDEPAPAVSGKGTLYAESERQVGAFNPSYHAPPMSNPERVLALDAPSPTLKANGGTDASGHQGGHAALYVRDVGRAAIPQSRRSLALDAPADAVQAGSPTSNHAPVVRVLFTSGREIVLDPKHPAATPDAPAPALRSGGRGHSAPPAYLAGSRPELLDLPSPAVTAVGECKGSGEGGNPLKKQRASDAVYLGAGIRRLTVLECAALQAFPPDWPWQGTKTAQYRQVGNAVPPQLAETVGRAILGAS